MTVPNKNESWFRTCYECPFLFMINGCKSCPVQQEKDKDDDVDHVAQKGED